MSTRAHRVLTSSIMLVSFRAAFIIVIGKLSLCNIAAAAKVENKGGMICIPNATFHIDCNRCKCSRNGMSIDCTDWSCDTLKVSYDLLLNLTLDCRPEDVFLYNNVKCLCGASGREALCSSASQELGHKLQPAKGLILREAQSRSSCTPGLLFKSGCRICICSDRGRAACIKLGCEQPRGLEPEREQNSTGAYDKICVPSSSFSVECNSCVCSEDGYSRSCEQWRCFEPEIRDDQILYLTFYCEANSTFFYNRHECLCLRSGRQAVCSLARPDQIRDYWSNDVIGMYYRWRNSIRQFMRWRKSVIASSNALAHVFFVAEFPGLCTPGVVFKDQCNFCLCGPDQRAACTRLDCRLARTARLANPTSKPIGFQAKLWRTRKNDARYCKLHYTSMYCRHLRKVADLF